MKKINHILLLIPLFVALVSAIFLTIYINKMVTSYNLHLTDLGNREYIKEIKCSYEELADALRSAEKVNRSTEIFDTKHSIRILSLYNQLVVIIIISLIIQTLIIFIYLFKFKNHLTKHSS